ncbi:MAG: oxidoreductase [Alphaproteobacteria bacterium]|nr:oxidoreductase [Alphaproteobacteria bacterium]
MTKRILITPRSLSRGGHEGLAPLMHAGYDLVFPSPGKIPSEAELLEAVPGCVGWLAGVEPVSAEVISRANLLRVISRNGSGVDNLPIPLIESRQIAIKRAAGTNARGVAELAFALTLAGLRRIVPTHIGMHAGNWPRSLGRELQGAKVAVIGLGAIGRQFAEFALAFGASVRGYDPFASDDVVQHSHFRRQDLNASLTGADVVSLHAPMPADGLPVLNAATLKTLASDAVIVNTARAGLVENRAMLDALNSGQVSTYATDVFEAEPPEPELIYTHPGVIMTSHIGGFTRESVDRTTAKAVEHILEVLGDNAP